MNTQNLAFYQFHTLVKERGTISARSGSWLQKIGALVAPILHANEPGCDDLHWLDQTILRPCCGLARSLLQQAGPELQCQQLVDVVVELVVR